MASVVGRTGRGCREGGAIGRRFAAAAFRRIAITLLPLALAACTHHGDVTGPHGRIGVRVDDEFGQPVAGKTVEVRELSLPKLTGPDGIATFTVPPGDYVVRAYDIGLPGPGQAYVDQEATVTAGETANVEFVDCQTCVAPATGGQGP